MLAPDPAGRHRPPRRPERAARSNPEPGAGGARTPGASHWGLLLRGPGPGKRAHPLGLAVRAARGPGTSGLAESLAAGQKRARHRPAAAGRLGLTGGPARGLGGTFPDSRAWGRFDPSAWSPALPASLPACPAPSPPAPLP